MKRYTYQLTLALFSCLVVISSCSIEKRQHLKGYHIDFKKRQGKEAEGLANSGQEQSPSTIKKMDRIKTDKSRITASSDNSLIGQIQDRVTEYRQLASSISEADDSIKCDRITMRNGDEIAAKVTEINEDDVKYKKCTNLDGPVYTIDKDDVFMIVYANGSKDVLNEPRSAPAPISSSTSSANDDQFDTKLYGMASLVAGIASILLCWIWAPVFGILVGLFAIIAGIIVAIKTSKNKELEGGGMAIGGIITGILGIIATIAFFLLILALIF